MAPVFSWKAWRCVWHMIQPAHEKVGVVDSQWIIHQVVPSLGNQASVAKLETSLSILSDKLELKVCGCNDKLPVLLSKVLAIARSFSPIDDRFKVVQEDMEDFKNY